MFFGIVAALFLLQALRGRRARPLPRGARSLLRVRHRPLLPYNLLRTWHLQLAIFWIATAWVARRPVPGAARGSAASRRAAPRRERPVRRAGRGRARQPGSASALGINDQLGQLWFWFGHQGSEYLDLGRLLAVAARGGPRLLAVPDVPGAAARDEDARALASCPRSSCTRPWPSRSSTCPPFSTAPTPTSRSSTTGASGSSTSGWRASSSSSRRCWWP